MPLTRPDSSGKATSRLSDEDLRGADDHKQRPWKDGYPLATADATFARERVGFVRTGAISPLQLPEPTVTLPIPIPGPKREREYTLDEVTTKWAKVPCVEPWAPQHWVRKNEDDHVQMEWEDPTGKDDSAALGMLLQKHLSDVDTNSSAKLLGLEHEIIHARVSVISKVAQATRVSERIAPINIRTERIHPKVQKKRGPAPAERNRTQTQKKRVPAPRVPFAQLSKFESSSEDDMGEDDEFGSSSEHESSGQDGSSSEHESSDGEGSPVVKAWANTMEM